MNPRNCQLIESCHDIYPLANVTKEKMKRGIIALAGQGFFHIMFYTYPWFATQ